MPTPSEPFHAAAGLSNAGVSRATPERDPEQATVKTADGVKFLHSGSGNSLGDGCTAGGSANAAVRDTLPETNTDDDRGGSREDGPGVPP